MKTLLIILVSLIVLNVLSRLFLRFWGPKLLQWYIRKKMNIPADQQPFGRQRDFQAPPNKDDKKDKKADDDGEYIDFEEIK